MKQVTAFLFCIAIFSIHITHFAYSAELTDWANSTVKIESVSPTFPDRPLRGSGLLFNKNGNCYVITSDHVVMNDPSGIAKTKAIHTVKENGTNQTMAIPLQFVRWKIASGLSLFKADLTVNQTRCKIPFEELITPFNPIDGDPETSREWIQLGYPLRELTLEVNRTSDFRGFVKSKEFFIGDFDLFSLGTSKGEIGLSGGPVMLERVYQSGVKTVGFYGLATHINSNGTLVYGLPIVQIESFFSQSDEQSAKENSIYDDVRTKLNTFRQIWIGPYLASFLPLGEFTRTHMEVSVQYSIKNLESFSLPESIDPNRFFADLSTRLKKENVTGSVVINAFKFHDKNLPFSDRKRFTFENSLEFFRLLARSELEPIFKLRTLSLSPGTKYRVDDNSKFESALHDLLFGINFCLSSSTSGCSINAALPLIAALKDLEILLFASRKTVTVSSSIGDETSNWALVSPADLENLVNGRDFKDMWPILNNEFHTKNAALAFPLQVKRTIQELQRFYLN